MDITRSRFSEGVYFAGLLILVTGLPLSMFLMSVSQMILLGSWIISGHVFQKLKSFFTNPVTLVLGSVFLLHLAGFAWSDDFDYAFHDARIKVPLLLLPLVISTSGTLSDKKFIWVLNVFIASVVLSTLVSMTVFMGFTSHKVNDIRDISIFISHIRFGLLICIAVFCLIWLVFIKNKNKKGGYKLILLLTILWLLVFLVIMEAVTAIIVLIAVSLVAGFVFLFRNPNRLLKAFLLIPLMLIVWVFIYVNHISNEISIAVQPDFSKMDSTTVHGNPYRLEVPYLDTENGNSVFTYICVQEIDSLWPTKSHLNIRGNDNKDQPIFYTLIRYLASKGLRKDADGINSLTAKDIKAIEAGHSNYRYTNTSSLEYRIYQIVWEYCSYQRNRKPEGHSVMQRFEFWKTGWKIFKNCPIFGVGTGDVQKAFDNQYELEKSKLPMKSRLRAHNQYLTFAITFGLTGFLLFIFSLLYPFLKMFRKTSVLYWLFLLTAMLSFIAEDTLETQAGVTFFAFFNAFFLFNQVRQKQEDEVKNY